MAASSKQIKETMKADDDAFYTDVGYKNDIADEPKLNFLLNEEL